MKKFNYAEWDIETEIVTGSDGFIYGNYVDWDNFRKDKQEELLQYFDINIPWDEEISFVDLCYVLSDENIIKLNSTEELIEEIELLCESKDCGLHDNLYIIPSLNSYVSQVLVSEIFDLFGVPEGVEYDAYLPEHLRYWYTEEDYLDEFALYKELPYKFPLYIETITKIKTDILQTSDDIHKKSLLLSSFIITESLFKSALVSNLPKEKYNNDINDELLSEKINDMLSTVEKRNKLYKRIFGKKAPKQKWINLRNSLAHDIESSLINENEIQYDDFKTKEEITENIEDIFGELLDFYAKLTYDISNNI